MVKGDFRFHTDLRVRWMECDAQGIVYAGTYMDYQEVAHADYFRNPGFSIYKVAQRGYFDTAMVKATLEYSAPARVDDILDIYVRVSRIGNTSVTLDMEIYLQGTDKRLTTGQAVCVGYDPATGTTRPVPADLRELIQHYEAKGEVLPLEGYPDLAAAATPL